ncbi:unnamed protein product [Cylindrotheca closterium]|uniref:Ribokinase n=1 Tax=Cylindrotheca closterium TaxID=2856 RepID=A0AAD2CDJ8_9STRA|nr:unnamed protein product [Cylindrotheca closterium]
MNWKLFPCLLLNLLLCPAHSNILVIGSANADTFLPIARLPTEGENLTLLPGKHPQIDLPGGKGCTQAVAVSKLTDKSCKFVGQLGMDDAGSVLIKALQDAGVDTEGCRRHRHLPTGRGYVFLTESGSVSAVVSGGSNIEGWSEWTEDSKEPISQEEIDSLLEGVTCIMLQREVPEYVNLLIASRAKQKGGITVIQDVGGEDRPISDEMLQHCDYLMPNESELHRLAASFPDPSATADNYISCARLLQKRGAKNVLVTRGSKGSTLVMEDGALIYQPAIAVSAVDVIDETGAGDCYRAAFAVALLEGQSLQACMKFASAAGACSVQVNGAVPSTPTRDEVDYCVTKGKQTKRVLVVPRGGYKNDDFPFLIGSRLNSMKDRPELWAHSLENPRDYVKRQVTIPGLTCVDFNYPQHFHSWSNKEAKAALDEAGLVAGAVCLRYPSKFARGAMNHPDVDLRKEAIELTKEAARTAIDLGCSEVVVWSAYDGYDYPFTVDYDEKWQQLVDAFQEICDAFPGIKFSLEYKPTDENTRFFTVPSTAAALLLVQDIDRPNMGLTLDVGHMLMSGENPGQSIAMVGKRKKLFGVQLNDGYTRLAAEDGMMFGSVHPSMALEIMYQLYRSDFDGHFYFDTFPQRSDPVAEAVYNIEQVKRFWNAATSISVDKLAGITGEHDAIGSLKMVDEALRK